MSLDQILEKHCVRSRGHIFTSILMKLSQNDCHGQTLDEFEIRSGGLKTRSLGNILEKLCTLTCLVRYS